MTNDLYYQAAVVVSLFVTYLLHSTIFLCLAWGVIAVLRSNSFTVSDRLWKLAAVAGLVTAPIQVMFGLSVNVADISLFDEKVELVAQSVDEPHGTREEKFGKREHVFDGDHVDVDEHPPSDRALVRTETSGSRITTHSFSVHRDSAKVEDSDTIGTDTQFTDISQSNEMALLVASESQPRIFEDVLIGTEPELVDSEIVVSADTLNRSQSDPSNTFLYTSAVVFVAFTLSGLLRIAAQSVSLRRRLAKATNIRDSATYRLLDRLLQRNCIRRSVRMLSSSSFSEPVAFGLWQWTIVLPVGLEHRLSKEELRALLAHELAHLVRGDVWWLWVGRVLCSCFVFQPLNLIARSRWQQAAEFLCDDWAVNRGVNELSLARCLTQIAEWGLASSDRAVALAASGPRKTIVRRVERLVSTTDRGDCWSHGLRRRILSVVCLAFVVAICTIGPRCGFEPSAVAATENSFGSTSADELISATNPSAAERSALSQELEQLYTELQTVGELLQRFPSDPEFQALAEQLNNRAARIKTQAQSIE